VDSITIDGMEEMEFRRSIETLLRRGQADEAARRLRSLLNSYAGEDGILPERFLQVSASDVRLEGWERLDERLREYDRPEMPLSAISIDILDPQGVGVRPDAQGCLKPVMETSYFSDSAYPFSEASRDDLLDGYCSFGCEWQGNFENVDTTISVEGIDDLYGATVGLENKVASSTRIEPAEVEAGSVGSCYLAVLIHQAIRDAAREKGLPRPICVLSGSNDAYPFFDAPAMTIDECLQDGAATQADNAAISEFDGEPENVAPASEFAGSMASLESLIGLGEKKKEKKPVLILDPDEADTAESLEMAVAAAGETQERLHIMPSLDLGAGPPPDYAEPPRHGAQARRWETGTADPERDEPEGPADISGWKARPPVEWEPDDPPPPCFDDQPEPPSPIAFNSGISGLPPAWETEEAPVPIDFSAYRPLGAAGGDAGNGDEPPSNSIERLHSEQPEPDPRPSLSQSESGEAGSAEGEFGEWRDGPDRTGDESLSGCQDDSPTGGFPAAGGRGAVDRDYPTEPLDLDFFAQAEEPSPEAWCSAYDLPTGQETGDNLSLAGAGSGGDEEAATDAPRPARHSIRVIAASVTNEANAGTAGRATADGSGWPRWIAWLAYPLALLRKRITGR
jgi:hypothetical protein